MKVEEQSWNVEPGNWIGSCDCSRGVRPVGEAEPAGIHAGTCYGLEADWRHGMYQGDLVVQGLHWDAKKDEDYNAGPD